MQELLSPSSSVTFVVADQSNALSDRPNAQLVKGECYFGAYVWLPYTSLWRACKFRDSLGYRHERRFVVLREAYPGDPCPAILKNSQFMAYQSISSAASEAEAAPLAMEKDKKRGRPKGTKKTSQ